MKKIKLTAVLLGALLFGTVNLQAQEHKKIRKEVNMEIKNGEKHLTITTTDADGNVSKEAYSGKEAEQKMKELEKDVPSGAKIEKVVDEEIIHHSKNGKGESNIQWIEHQGSEGPGEKISVEIDEENGTLTIKDGEEERVIDLTELEDEGLEQGEHKMIFVSKTLEDDDQSGEHKHEIIVIKRRIRIEEDQSLPNDLKGINFKAYPNPNNGKFNIELKHDGKTPTFFRISDLQGKEYYKGEIKAEKKGTYTQPVKMEKFSKGVYLIQIIQGDKVASKKVVVE